MPKLSENWLTRWRPEGCHVWVQAKTDGKISPAEWNTLRMCSGWAGADPLLARKGPRGIPVIYELLLGDKIPYSRERPCTLYIFPEVDIIQTEIPTDDGETDVMEPIRTTRDNPYCFRCGDLRGGPYGHDSNECTWNRTDTEDVSTR